MALVSNDVQHETERSILITELTSDVGQKGSKGDLSTREYSLANHLGYDCHVIRSPILEENGIDIEEKQFDIPFSALVNNVSSFEKSDETFNRSALNIDEKILGSTSLSSADSIGGCHAKSSNMHNPHPDLGVLTIKDISPIIQEEKHENDFTEQRSLADSLSLCMCDEGEQDIRYRSVESKEDDFDTDLEIDDEKWMRPKKYDHDLTGRNKYLRACRLNDVTPVRSFIEHMLENHLRLAHRGISTSDMKALAVALKCNTSIEELNLEDNWLGEYGAQHLCRVLKENVYIVTLNLGENRLGDIGAQSVFELVLNSKTIEELNLSGNKISDLSAELISQMLKKNSSLRQLNLGHNGISDVGSCWVKEGLAENEYLEKFDISWNHFQSKGCMALAEGIKENVGLKYFNVSMNGFGTEGAMTLGEAISVNRTLQTLDVSHCRLPLAGAASLALGLQRNDRLQKLIVSYNPIDPDGTLALLCGVEKNECSALTLLDLGRNSRVLPEFQVLQEKLEIERDLRVLHAGVMLVTRVQVMRIDVVEAFKRDPMTKLKEWVEKAGYRLIDLLRHFDRDNSMTISRNEFTQGIKSTGIAISDDQIEILLNRLDKDGDGEIEYGELVDEDNTHRTMKRDVAKYEEEQNRHQHKAKQSVLELLQRRTSRS